MAIWSSLLDIADRAARKVGQVFLRNPGDTANMGDATTPVRVDPTGTTSQPVTQPTATSLKAEVVGPTADNAANPATKVSILPGRANAANPAWTEGNVVPASFDLGGKLRITQRPFEVLGVYAVNGNVSYTTTTVNQPLFSFRWGDATRFAIPLLIEVHVVATAFTTAGLVERQLIIARAFTVSDTGGTALTPTLNNQKFRTTPFGTSLVTDIRVGVLTAGTRTLDTNPISSVAAWMGAVGNVIGDARPAPLYDGRSGVQYPLVFAQNEGFIVRFGAAETASTRQSFFNVVWAEVNAY